MVKGEDLVSKVVKVQANHGSPVWGRCYAVAMHPTCSIIDRKGEERTFALFMCTEATPEEELKFYKDYSAHLERKLEFARKGITIESM